MSRVHVAVAFVLALIAAPAGAADYPAPKQGDWIARDFKFHTGEVMPELRLHYTTIGDPSGPRRGGKGWDVDAARGPLVCGTPYRTYRGGTGPDPPAGGRRLHTLKSFDVFVSGVWHQPNG